MTHVVMIVPNDVSIDSRVQKTARSAQDAGYTVTVLGASAKGAHWSTSLNGVLVARVPRTPVPPKHRLSKVAVGIRRRVNGMPGLVGAPAKGAARVLDGAGQMIAKRVPMPYRAFADEEVRDRVKRASLLEADVATWTARFLRPLVDLNPDIIYVHDAVLLLAGGIAKEQLESRGRKVQLIADVHEWWPGVSGTTPHRIKSRTDLEDEWVPAADRVLTVSDTLAGWLQERFALEGRPTSIENAAVAAVRPAEGRQTIREECGLASGTPLLVYAGAVAYARGVDVAIEAVAGMPGVHLAVVAGKRTQFVEDLEDLARQREMADRFHIVPFVPPNSIGWYLRSASAGLAPFRRSKSHDSALATKISEYLSARLPLVVSDCESQARFVRANGVGEVFIAEDVEGARGAMRAVLEDRDRYVSAITASLLSERTWDYQAQVLVRTLGELADPSPPEFIPQDPGPSAMQLAREVLELHRERNSGGLGQGTRGRQYRTLFGHSKERQLEALAGLARIAGGEAATVHE